MFESILKKFGEFSPWTFEGDWIWGGVGRSWILGRRPTILMPHPWPLIGWKSTFKTISSPQIGCKTFDGLTKGVWLLQASKWSYLTKTPTTSIFVENGAEFGVTAPEMKKMKACLWTVWGAQSPTFHRGTILSHRKMLRCTTCLCRCRC